MNCRRGDMAVIVRSDFPENVGGFVRVLKASTPMAWSVEALCHLSGADDFGGVCRVAPGFVANCDDANLRPIRDNPGADETLTWAGLPKPLTAPKETA